MSELTAQLSFSLQRLLKQSLLCLFILFVITVVPLLLILANRIESFEENWLALLHVQMILSILLAPVLLNVIWSGRIHHFERTMILYYLRHPSNYFLSQVLMTWLALSGSLMIVDSMYWILGAKGADVALWAGTALQIILTTGLLLALTGILSLLLQRTFYSILPLLLYLLASLSFVERPMLALWFSPNITEQVVKQPGLILERGWLFLWILLLLSAGAFIFRKKAARR